MKKITKKSPSKAAHKKAVKNLDVKPSKGGTVRGGAASAISKGWIDISSTKYKGWIE